jgi:acyl carrier protein
MTAESPSGGATSAELLGEIVGILLEVTTESAEWAAAITPNARLEVDLGMESIELLELAELLQSRYGQQVDLRAFVAGLDIDQIIEFSVADLIDFVAANRVESTAGSRPERPPGSVPPAVPAGPVMPEGEPVMPGQRGDRG